MDKIGDVEHDGQSVGNLLYSSDAHGGTKGLEVQFGYAESRECLGKSGSLARAGREPDATMILENLAGIVLPTFWFRSEKDGQNVYIEPLAG
jgi:hypothetical protein